MNFEGALVVKSLQGLQPPPMEEEIGAPVQSQESEVAEATEPAQNCCRPSTPVDSPGTSTADDPEKACLGI